jgi:hypothetical protein
MKLDDDILIISYTSSRQTAGELKSVFTACYTAKLWFLLWISILVAMLFIIIK